MLPLFELLNSWKYTRLSLGVLTGLGFILTQFPEYTIAAKVGQVLLGIGGTLGAASVGPSKERSALDTIQSQLQAFPAKAPAPK